MVNQVIFFGSSDFSVIVLKKLLESHIRIEAVVTTPDRPSGRHLNLTPNSLKAYAITEKLPILEELSRISPTVTPGLVVAYGKIIPLDILNKFSSHLYNIHPSLLPKYRGPSPLQYQILDNAPVGVSLIQLDAKMDHGSIVSQKTDSLLPNDTWITLGNRLFKIGTDLFLTDDLSKTYPQNDSKASYTQKITRRDGFVDYQEFLSGLHTMNPRLLAKYRAYYGWPGIWTINPEGIRTKLISLNPILIQEESKSPTEWQP